MHVNEDFLLDLLMENGVLNQESYEEVLATSHEHGLSVGATCEKLEIMSAADVLVLLAAEYDLESVNLAHYKIPKELVKLVPNDVAHRYQIVPIGSDEESLTIAMADPTDVQVFDALSHLLEKDVQGVVATSDDISEALNKYYNEDLTFVDDDDDEPEIIGFSEIIQDESDVDETPIVQLVSLIIVKAYQAKASDIHIEPLEDKLRLRYRIDGILHEIEDPPKYLQNNITSRLKIMARIDITEKRLPQDGRISMRLKDVDLDLRVSSIPTTYGESLVMRILDKSNIKLGIPELGMFADDQQIIERIITYPDGIFLVTGPTGSGKTTSLYAFLNTLNLPDRKIITAEDPIEYDLQGINQCQVNVTKGMTFVKILRSMLRQAPNIIMVGEIRDLETASIAIQASLTGHMVFSTLHTNDATSAIARLTDIGVQPFLIASALKAVMAQRLCRRICDACKQPYQPTELELEYLEMSRNKEPGHILLVEDDPATQKLIKKILFRNDFKVKTAKNGIEALEVLAKDDERKIDIVITDLQMPEMDGHDLTKAINEQYHHIPVVIMSGADQEELDKMTQLEIKGCLLKPINSLHLLNTLQRIYSKVLKRRLDESSSGQNDILKWSKGCGCQVCGNSGYKGRLGIYEIFHINPEIQEMIFKQESTASLRHRARGMGMRTLRDDGVRKATSGLTTIEEVIRMTVDNEVEKFN
ncbi:MAG: Flp pilus assembly complex ATPase component TadA [Lentisphaeraceae bacterium]|nr:Flp pilus assembly complex ATPase component TadA [Lentisphaeraceae bacterium]